MARTASLPWVNIAATNRYLGGTPCLIESVNRGHVPCRPTIPYRAIPDSPVSIIQIES